MRLVLGELNGVSLRSILEESTPFAIAVDAAVAYASGDPPLFKACRANNLPLRFFGLLDEGEAVALPILKAFLESGSAIHQCYLVRGHFHPKVIWWREFGVYIGSANLTEKAWTANIECGLFLSESEIDDLELRDDLERLFWYLEEKGMPLRKEIVDKFDELRRLVGRSQSETNTFVADQFRRLFEMVSKNLALTHAPPRGERSTAERDAFVREWIGTLQLLRDLAVRLERDGRRPRWVSRGADPTIHLDQFLHAFYDQEILRGEDEGKSIEKVEAAHERWSRNPDGAFDEALAWWVALAEPRHGEDIFISTGAPRVRQLLASDHLDVLTVDEFSEVGILTHAFKMHARQASNVSVDLPEDSRRSIEERTEYLARWVWKHPTAEGMTVQDVLRFVLYGRQPPDMEARLWAATREPKWHVRHFGLSCLGEIVGLALPDRYPPRNNRTNKALRSLGHKVQLLRRDE